MTNGLSIFKILRQGFHSCQQYIQSILLIYILLPTWSNSSLLLLDIYFEPPWDHYYSEVVNSTQSRPFTQEEKQMNSFHQSKLYFSIQNLSIYHLMLPYIDKTKWDRSNKAHWYHFRRLHSLLLSPGLTTNFRSETNVIFCIHPVSKEAVVQYEQYEQEVKNLQRLIEEAHRIIQDRPVSTSNIQELQAQIQHHEVR